MAAKFMKQLGYKKYSLLGWSDGGITAMILAARNRDKVDRLVVWGANAYVNAEDRAMLMSVNDPEVNWSPSYRDQFIKLYGKDEFLKLWARLVAHYVTLEDICTSELAMIKCPVLIVHGDKDPMISSEHPEHLVKNIPNATLYRIKEGKHNVHQKFAKEFNEIVEDFIDSPNEVIPGEA